MGNGVPPFRFGAEDGATPFWRVGSLSVRVRISASGRLTQ
jgi:hypothetical protein